MCWRGAVREAGMVAAPQPELTELQWQLAGRFPLRATRPHYSPHYSTEAADHGAAGVWVAIEAARCLGWQAGSETRDEAHRN